MFRSKRQSRFAKPRQQPIENDEEIVSNLLDGIIFAVDVTERYYKTISDVDRAQKDVNYKMSDVLQQCDWFGAANEERKSCPLGSSTMKRAKDESDELSEEYEAPPILKKQKLDISPRKNSLTKGTNKKVYESDTAEISSE